MPSDRHDTGATRQPAGVTAADMVMAFSPGTAGRPATEWADADQGDDGAALRLRAILDTLTEGVVVHAAGTGAITDWNVAAERILRLTGAQLAGCSAMDAHWRTIRRDGSALPGATLPAMRVLATGERASDLVGVHTPDGALRWLNVQAAPIRSRSDGTVSAAVVTFTDVTESFDVQANHALTAAGVGTWTWYPGSDSVRWSDQVGPLLGRPLGWTPASFAEFVGIVHVDDRPAMLAKLDAAMHAGTPYDPRYRVTWPDGSLHWLQGGDAWVERGDDGTVHRMDGAVWDVTPLEQSLRAHCATEAALRESEIQYRTLVDASPDGVLVHVDGEIRYANAACAALLGVPNPSALLGRRLVELLPPEDRDAMTARCTPSARCGEPATSELVLQRLDGAERVDVEIAQAPVRFNDAGVIRDAMQATIRDVGARHRAEAERRARDARLQHAQKLEAVGQLAGGLAHDLNNLLLVVSGNCELVEAELGSSHAVRPMLAEMSVAVDRAQRLLRSLLTFSRRETVQSEVLDVVDVIRSFVPLLRTVVGQRIALITDLPDGVIRFPADRSHVEQILMNLVANGRDALLDGRHGHAGQGGTITVRVRVGDLQATEIAAGSPLHTGPHVLLTVSDDGHGMPAETLTRALEPFYTTKAVGAGTGLGLATVFGIVRQLDGDVRLTSEVGVGTTVRVFLPLAADDPSAPVSDAALVATPIPVDEIPPTLSSAARAGLTGQTILLVEDEASVRRLATRVLQRHGARVLEAANGVEALAVWGTHQREITLVITDVRMPEMDGIALVRHLRDASPRLPVIIMSGYADGASVQDWAERVAFVPKPFALEALLQAAGEVLAAR